VKKVLGFCRKCVFWNQRKKVGKRPPGPPQGGRTPPGPPRPPRGPPSRFGERWLAGSHRFPTKCIIERFPAFSSNDAFVKMNLQRLWAGGFARFLDMSCSDDLGTERICWNLRFNLFTTFPGSLMSKMAVFGTFLALNGTFHEFGRGDSQDFLICRTLRS